MRSWPRQFASFSINTGGQSSFWQHSQNCRSSTCAHCSWPVVRKFGGELPLQLLQLADFGFCLDFLLVMVWTL